MSLKLIDEISLVAIGDAIREKNGSSQTYSPEEMVSAIGDISGGGEPVDFFHYSGNGNGLFLGKIGHKILNDYLSELTFTDMRDMNYAFYQNNDYNISPSFPTDLSSLTINFRDNSDLKYNSSYGGNISLSSCFYGSSIQKIPKFVFNNTGVYNCANMFGGYNNKVENVDDFMTNTIFSTSSFSNYSNMFSFNYGIKTIPHLEKLKNTGMNSTTTIYNNGFYRCIHLQEIINLPVITPSNNNITSNNMFKTTFQQCPVNRITFETNNGEPLIANWKNQIIPIGTSEKVGWTDTHKNTAPTVSNQATYEQYKNEVYKTSLREYSRYNHTSAVETINSLPDTSAVSNGTNKIQFCGASGSATDGGAISNLTSEEIAVATAKGWTVEIQ